MAGRRCRVLPRHSRNNGLVAESSDYFWQNPLANATFRPLTDFEGAEQEAAISRDGKFVAFLSDRDGPTDHPLWSPDGAFIYFVYGLAPNEMDIWRIAPTGGEPERITFHNSRVAYPVLLDKHTLLYLATADDGSESWLHVMNVEHRVSRRISVGVEQYTSLSASADGRPSRLPARSTFVV